MDELIKAFGHPAKEDTKNYTFQCPLCKAEGSDQHCDNLKIKKTTWLKTCFKSNEHTKQIRADYKSLKTNVKFKPSTIDFNEDKIKENMKYLRKCQRHLNDDYNALISHRGLKVSTLKELRVGIDSDKACWVFPMYHYSSNKLIGFEYRDIKLLPRKEGGQMWHEEGSFSCLCRINKKPKKDIINEIVITEGFLDAYLMHQYIEENPGIRKYHILTPSCGVASIPGLLEKTVEFQKPDVFVNFCLDNDKAGDEVRRILSNDVGFVARNGEQLIYYRWKKIAITGFINLDGYKDFGEWYNGRIENV